MVGRPGVEAYSVSPEKKAELSDMRSSAFTLGQQEQRSHHVFSTFLLPRADIDRISPLSPSH
jgi:hypothetical protein